MTASQAANSPGNILEEFANEENAHEVVQLVS